MKDNYYNKYLKYKYKYILLKNQIGGDNFILDYKTLEDYVTNTGVYTIQNYKDKIGEFLSYENDELLTKIINIYTLKKYKDADNRDKYFANFNKYIDTTDKEYKDKEKQLQKRLYDIIFFAKYYSISTPNDKKPTWLLPIDKEIILRYKKIYDYKQIILHIINDLLITYDFVVLFKDHYISFKKLLISIQKLDLKLLSNIDINLSYQELLVLYYQIFITFNKDINIQNNQKQLKATNINVWNTYSDDIKYYILFLLMKIIHNDDDVLIKEINKYYENQIPSTSTISEGSLFNYKLYKKSEHIINYYINDSSTIKKFYMCKKSNPSELITKDEFITKIKKYRDDYNLKDEDIYKEPSNNSLIKQKQEIYKKLSNLLISTHN